MNAAIALLTDFGTRDTYVGVMKGVMQRIAPEAHFIDITHEIAPQNVQQGAFALLNSYRYFAPGTIFLVVVDPGVGSIRKPIAVHADNYTFVAPDNGVLSYVLAESEHIRAVELSNEAFQLTPVSNTFHGRDIFAPAAAHLANGEPLHKFGAPIEHLIQYPLPEPKIGGVEITGQALYNDHFGNVVTNIGSLAWVSSEHLSLTPRFRSNGQSSIIAAESSAKIKNLTLAGIRRAYSEVEKGQLLLLVGSSGFLEIAVNQGNAAQQLALSPGDTITLQIG